jgi:hypothetical protein
VRKAGGYVPVRKAGGCAPVSSVLASKAGSAFLLGRQVC